MKKNHRFRSLAAVALASAGWLSYIPLAQAQYVVSDPLNTVQATITAGSHVMSYAEQVTQYAKQVQQYETQLQQYQAQLQNLQTLGNFKWSDASTSLNQLVGTVNGTTGAYNNFLTQFQTQTQWNQHPPTLAAYRQSTSGASSTGNRFLRGDGAEPLHPKREHGPRCRHVEQNDHQRPGRSRGIASVAGGDAACECTGQSTSATPGAARPPCGCDHGT